MIQYNFDDIERNGYVFTDGAGLISERLAKLVSDKFGLNRTASAF